MQIESSYLRGADVYVIRAGKVGSVGRAQEAESVRQHFESSFAENAFAAFRLVLQERKDQVLLAQPVGVFDFVGDRHIHEFGYVEVFEIGQMHGGGPTG